MSVERLKTAQDRLKAYQEAELAVLTGQEYRMGTRLLRRADLKEIKDAIENLSWLVQQLEDQQNGKTANRARRIVLRDI